MLKDLFVELISLSDQMRCGYKISLGIPHPAWEEILTNINHSVPQIDQERYSTFAGTRRDLEKQKLMDFIPGYRLIHIEELKAEYDAFAHMAGLNPICENQIKTAAPLLADSASNYICYVKK